MANKKINKLYVFDESTNHSIPTNQMFTLKVLCANNIEDVAIYKSFEEAESNLIEYLKKGTCGWIVSNNE
tara:strand:+ start:2113 stop:2322 length:210 start_codon:yes stop_codon:yes gene_type:complete